MRRAGSVLWQRKRCVVFSCATVRGIASESVPGRAFAANGGLLRTTPPMLAPHDGRGAAPPPPVWGGGTTPVWVRDLNGAVLFQGFPTVMNVDGLKKAIAPRMDPQGQAAITIYDHQRQAMADPAEQLVPNTSETPYVFQMPTFDACIRQYADAVALRFAGYDGPRARVGRTAFDHLLHAKFEGLFSLLPSPGSNAVVVNEASSPHSEDVVVNERYMSRQMTTCLVLRCASGVGKTFAALTARRGLRTHCDGLDYEPVMDN